jgi:exodeoxyribonuclease V beta subunit
VSKTSFNITMRKNVKTNWPGMLQGPQMLLNDSTIVDMFARLCWQHEKLGLSKEPEPTHPCAVASKNYLVALKDTAGLLGRVGYEFRLVALQRLDTLKRERSIAMPDDLIYLLRDSLLSEDQSSVALVDEALERFPLALVDETQDTDAATWEVLFRLYEKKGGLVAVGDPKQTIYRFRGADVFEYLNAKERCAERLSLKENFRSHPRLLYAFNQLFSAPTAFELEGIEFDNALPSSRTVEQLIEDSHALPAFQISVFTKDSISNKTQAESLALGWAVQQVQRFLKCSLGKDVMQPSNIAILVDSHAQAKKVRRALNGVGIAAAENAKQWVTTTDEADELLVILDAMASPKNKSLVYRALATRLLQQSDIDLAQLRSDSLAWQHCLDQWLRFNQLWQQQGCYAALTGFFEYWKTAARLMRLQSGERRWANVLHLIEMMALQAHRSTSPLAARQWLASTRQIDESEADNEQLLLRLETDQALISITTIHSSKGLEYDIVLLPFVSDGKKCDLAKEWPYLSHSSTGHNERSTQLRFEYPVAEPFATRCEIEVQAEAARKLYVALTRAKSCCGVFLFDSGASVKYSAWHRLIARHLQAHDPKQVAQLPFDFSAQLQCLNDWQEKAPTVFSVDLWAPENDAESAAARLDQTINYPPPVFVLQSPQATWVRRPAWATTSFSSLAHQHEKASSKPAVEEVWLRDHDANVMQTAASASLPAPLSLPLSDHDNDSIRWRFPRGEIPGQYLHRAFELHNFQERFNATSLQKLGAQFDLQADFEQTAQWLNEILDASFVGPATAPIVLGNLSNTARKTELEFNMQVTPGLQLRGFIDLVFQWQGKAYILDWKSNWLGIGSQAYQPKALQAAMQTNQYDLQARIYALAVHRWLVQRLGSQYQYDVHFGGVVYLFLRGVGLDAAAGVHCWRPSEQEILRLQKQGPI